MCYSLLNLPSVWKSPKRLSMRSTRTVAHQADGSSFGATMEEIWRSVFGYEGLYEVSNKGNVRSVPRVQPHGQWNSLRVLKGRVIKTWISKSHGKSAYRHVALSKDGIVKHVKNANLVCAAFHNNPNNLPVVNHIDGNKQNDSADNLEYCTYGHNNAHAYRTGLKPPVINCGEKCGTAKLKETDITAIRKMGNYGITTKEIANIYSIDYKHIWRILKGISWKHSMQNKKTQPIQMLLRL